MDTYSSEHLHEALNDRGLVALPCPSVGCMTLVNAGGSRFAPCASDLAAAGFSTGASCIITGALPRADLWSAVSWGGRSKALVVGAAAARRCLLLQRFAHVFIIIRPLGDELLMF